jgi:hypothetical protein
MLKSMQVILASTSYKTIEVKTNLISVTQKS